jgi:pyrroline-5-carboxylate reductase
MLIGQGVSALCRTSNVSDEDFDLACSIFASAGKIIKISEDEMNKIICVTGSSPAYVFMVIKAMLDAATNQGLLRDKNSNASLNEKEILDAICDTLIGSAMLVKASNKTLDEQIATVCSKGGTTEQAVAELERYKLYEAFDSAMAKCTKRAYELGDTKK